MYQVMILAFYINLILTVTLRSSSYSPGMPALGTWHYKRAWPHAKVTCKYSSQQPQLSPQQATRSHCQTCVRMGLHILASQVLGLSAEVLETMEQRQASLLHSV